jgi:hypothetical protein
MHWVIEESVHSETLPCYINYNHLAHGTALNCIVPDLRIISLFGLKFARKNNLCHFCMSTKDIADSNPPLQNIPIPL